MIISHPTQPYAITDTPLKDEDWVAFLADPNCQKSFPNLMPLGLPQGTYLKMWHCNDLIGAMVILSDPTQDNRVQIHLIKFQYSSLKYIRHLCELCTIYCQLHNLIPHTIVRDIPELRYMVNFLHRTGAPSITKDGFHIFYLPRDWRPKYVTAYTVSYE